MRHWEDAIFARLLLERGVVSERLLEGIPEDREEPLHAYLVRTGILREDQAVRLRGEALEMPLVCVDCGRESILLRCVSADRLACPACGGVPLIRPGPAGKLLARRSLPARVLPAALVAGLALLLAVGIWKTPFPKGGFSSRRPSTRVVSRELAAGALQPVEEALERNDLIQARFHVLDVLDGSEPEVAAELERIRARLDNLIGETEEEFREGDLAYATWIEEAEAIVKELEGSARTPDGSVAVRSRAAGIRLDEARGFYRRYLYPDNYKGLPTIFRRSRKVLGAEKRVRREYLARSEERWSAILDSIVPPQELGYLDTAAELLATFPDLGVEEVEFRREGVGKLIEDEEAAHRTVWEARSREIRRLLRFEIPNVTRGRVADLPVAGLAAIVEETEELRSLAAAQFERWILTVPGSVPGEAAGARSLVRRGVATARAGRYEVTNRQYAFFIEETGRPAPDHWIDGKVPAGKEDHPVVNVTFDDAAAYARWAGGRLPTLEEWRWAAQGGPDDREYPWGDDHVEGIANLKGDDTAPVGSFPGDRTVHGALDMGGNVGEWVVAGLGKAVKGGSFDERTPDLAKVRRTWPAPPEKADNIGFRVWFDIGG